MMDWNSVKLQDFWFEAIAIAILTTYMVIFLTGSSTNKQIARKWLQYNQKTWSDNFAQIGHNDHKLIQDGPREYVFYATGRDFVDHCYVLIQLIARHDLVVRAMDWFLGVNTHDKVTIDIHLPEDGTDSICFAIIPRNKVNTILKERWDLVYTFV